MHLFSCEAFHEFGMESSECICIVKNMQLHIVHEKLERPYGIVKLITFKQIGR
jgi:hypothetical protein